MNKNNKIGAFTKFCCTIGNLPSSYMMSMTYEEQLIWLSNYLEKTIVPAIQQNGEAIEELQDYVKNYFEDLDVQEEINNKLDEMAESGELTEIIAQYLQLAGILAYNTLDELENAENIVEGSFTKTYGKLTYNDGYGAFYKIRALINTDVVDGENLVALVNYPTLVAEKMKDSIIDEILNNINDIEDSIDEINREKNMLIIGDSWSMPSYPYVTSQDNCWYNKVANYLNANIYNYAESGAGYSITQNSFLSQINDAISNIEDSSKIDYIFLFGGYNDLREGLSITVANFISKITECINTLKSNFTNAKIYVIGCNTPYKLLKSELGNINYIHNSYYFTEMINSACVECNVNFINSLPFLLGATDNVNETLHPNDKGMNLIAYSIINVLGGKYSKQPLINETAIYTAEKVQNTAPDLINDKVINCTDYIDVNFTITLNGTLASNTLYSYYLDELPTNYMLGKSETNDNGTSVCNIYFTTYNYRNLLQLHFPSGASGKYNLTLRVPIN